MADYTSRLPDELICYIFSFLTVRDAVRARLSSARWLQLPDSRSVLQFECLSVLKKENLWKSGPKFQSMFVSIVNRFLELWMGNRISKLLVEYPLRNEHASHIDRWIATSIAMEVEEIELNLIIKQEEAYVFPCHLLYFRKAPHLKHLSLVACIINLPQCTSWLSNLTTLKLRRVPLHESGWQHILSGGSNLISLCLIKCMLPRTLFIDGQLLCLKKLLIHYHNPEEMKLNCPNLEVFDYFGHSCELIFAHVPILREANVLFIAQAPRHFSKLFYHVTTNAPQLQALSLRITTEVRRLIATVATCSIKRLNLDAWLPIGFDLLTMTRILNASPFLETLQLKFYCSTFTKHSRQREYPDRPHFQLKQVKFEGFLDQWNEMELAIYLLRNAVALEQMVIQVDERWSKAKQKASTLLLLQKEINPNAEVVIL